MAKNRLRILREKMITQTKTPRVVRGRTELWVPHNAGEIAFASPPVGPNTYQNVGKQILDNNQQVPTGDYTASLLHAAYCNDSVADEPEFANVRDIMKRNWLWVFNRNLWTPTGVYVVQDRDAVGRSQPLDISDLEKRLKSGKEAQGIRFSEDGLVRFAPKGSYSGGFKTPEEFAKDAFVIASCGQEGAEKLGEASSKLRNKPYVYALNISEEQTPKQKVSAVCEDVDGLGFGGCWDGGSDCLAFGVWK